MKKTIAMLLCAALSLSLLAGCGGGSGSGSESSQSGQEEFGGTEDAKGSEATEAPENEGEEAPAEEASGEKTYDERLSATMTTFYSLYKSDMGDAYKDDFYFQYMQDKFALDMELWACAMDSEKEKVRVWINGGTMPDAMVWNSFGTAEYYEYVDQGLFHPLPEDWESRWPNLANMVSKTGVKDMLKVDGLTYAIPHANFGNYLNMNVGVNNKAVLFRKDLAKEVGMEDLGADTKITLSELKEYLEKVKEAGLVDIPTVAADSSSICEMFRLANGISTQTFIETDDGFVWGPAVEAYPEMIAQMREWYKAGLLDADYYANKILYYKNAYNAGQIAAIYSPGHVGDTQLMAQEYRDKHPDEKLEGEKLQEIYDKVGDSVITSEDGQVYAAGTYNYWTVTVFKPDIDEAVLERILDMFDYLCTKEGQAECKCGIFGQDWDYDADGNIVISNEEIANGDILVDDCRVFNLMGYTGDDFAYSGADASRDPQAVELGKAMYAVKNDKATIVFSPNDKVTALNTEAKSNYSVNVDAKITELVCGDADIETEWQNFIDTNRNMWEPVLDDLNEEYGY